MQPIIFFGKEFNINPVAFSLGNAKVHWYGLIILAGFLLNYFLVKYRLRSTLKSDASKGKDPEKADYTFGINFDDCVDYIIGALIIGFLSARAYFVLFNLEYYLTYPSEILKIWHGGIAIYGGILGAAVYAIIFCKKKKINFWNFADLLVPYLACAQSIGRWGNFVNQEAYGGVTTLPWKMGIYDSNINAYTYVHPTFLYESICTMAIFFILLKVSKKRKFKGQILYLYAILYGTARAVIEGLRTDSLMLANFRISQVLSVIFVIIFGITYFYASRRRVKGEENS
ncbi:MAG: prolipoprotein diacylglyceryl transferase [Clostridia bacterium]|nr:prolipoprotein diacylglyceryl transferase [Clostridia bacterium]